MTRGGMRPGAGRKKKEGRAVLFCRVNEQTKAKLEQMAADEGVSVGEILERLLKQ